MTDFDPRQENIDLFLAGLEELIGDHPEMRFGQILSNLDTWIRARTSIDLFYIPDNRLMAEIERMNVEPPYGA
jgi:hypothetical protein